MRLSKTRQILLGAAALLAFTFAPSAQAQFNLITNGGFEDGFSNWILTPGTFSFAGQNATFAQSGIGYANLERTGSIGTLSQTISTVPGQTYSISFYLANDSGVAPNSFAAAFGPSGAPSQFSIVNSPAFAYTNITFSTVATTTSSVLQFRFQHDDDFFRLDTVTVVPEPSTNALMLLSGIGVVGFVYHRRRQSAQS
ncbi:MAG: PEP-CTERM sorting domain-containing protein [Verrucomicrobiota bacterium]|nr:PEP-CTERM sorting domain-containing protein [Verrucomicrobiota bacterium]